MRVRGSKNGSPVVGTLARLDVLEHATFVRGPEGEILAKYDGTHEVRWSSMVTVRENGGLLFVCLDGSVWLQDQIDWQPVEEAPATHPVLDLLAEYQDTNDLSSEQQLQLLADFLHERGLQHALADYLALYAAEGA